MSEARRSRAPRGRLHLAAVLCLALGGCAYFNTFYNANRLFEDAERMRTAKGGTADKAAGQYAEARRNRLLLRAMMDRHGFDNYTKEWWHYTLRSEPYPQNYFDMEIR